MILTLDNLRLYADDIDDCWIWKNSCGSHGYPQACIHGLGTVIVRTYIFTHLLKREKHKKHVISNVCLNKLCINPAHIVCMPPGKVQSRVYEAGLRNPAVETARRRQARRAGGQKVLTEEQVAFIRGQDPDRSYSAIAREMGLHHKSVSRVIKNETHRTIAAGASVFAWRP